MRFLSPMLDRVKSLYLILAVIAVATAVSASLWSQRRNCPANQDKKDSPLLASSSLPLYTEHYPASSHLEEELKQLRAQKRLLPHDEILIQRSVIAVSERLHIPTSLLWCLFFQESRLNRWLGIHQTSGALGLGQFEYFSFFEVNHHLDQYTKDNLETLISLLGTDVRPIEPRKKTPNHPSSYYSVPTAVISSAAYLNNRYLQLAGILSQHSIPFDPQILWLYAAMAYNKGTRSVLSFWNNERRRAGKQRVVRITSDRAAAVAALNNSRAFGAALRRIWPVIEAAQYAKELTIHMKNIQSCSLYRETIETEPTMPGEEF